jgi:hypothetical protein
VIHAWTRLSKKFIAADVAKKKHPPPSYDDTLVPVESILDVIQHRALIPRVQTVDHGDQLPEHRHHLPVVLGAALDVSALPVLLHQIGDIPALLLVAAGGLDRGAGLVGDEVLLVADDEQRHVRHVAALADLLPQRADVLEGLQVGQVEDEDVGGGAPQAVVAVVGPLVIRVHREVGDDGEVADLDLVQALVGDDGWVIGVLAVGGDVLLAEVVPHELL